MKDNLKDLFCLSKIVNPLVPEFILRFKFSVAVKKWCKIIEKNSTKITSKTNDLYNKKKSSNVGTLFKGRYSFFRIPFLFKIYTKVMLSFKNTVQNIKFDKKCKIR